MKKSVFLIIFSLFLVNCIISQTITFKFDDYRTKTPLANILILSGNKVIGATDNMGKIVVEKDLIVDNLIRPFSYLYETYDVQIFEKDRNLKVELVKFEEKPEVFKQIENNGIYQLLEKTLKIVKKSKKQYQFSAKYFNILANDYFITKERKSTKKDSKNEMTLIFKKSYTVKSEITLDDTVKNGLMQLYSNDLIRNNFDEIFTKTDQYEYSINAVVYNKDLAKDVVEIIIKNKEAKETIIVGSVLITADGTNILQYSKEIIKTQNPEYMPKYFVIYSNTKNKIPYYIEYMSVFRDEANRNTSTNKLFLR